MKGPPFSMGSLIRTPDCYDVEVTMSRFHDDPRPRVEATLLLICQVPVPPDCCIRAVPLCRNDAVDTCTALTRECSCICVCSSRGRRGHECRYSVNNPPDLPARCGRIHPTAEPARIDRQAGSDDAASSANLPLLAQHAHGGRGWEKKKRPLVFL